MRISDWSSDVCSSDLFAKGNIEAIVESSKIAAKGFEALGQDSAEYGRKSFEDATATLKQFAAVKSPAEFFKLQSDYVRSAFDAVVAETSKKTEAVLKLAGDVAQPLSNRAAVAARSEEHTSELQSLMRISYAVFCLKKKKQ